MGDAEWIAARKALSLAAGELHSYALTAPYADLSPEMLRLRMAHDSAQQYVESLARVRRGEK